MHNGKGVLSEDSTPMTSDSPVWIGLSFGQPCFISALGLKVAQAVSPEVEA